MRDPDRIERILELLRLYWSRNPDLRLGQLITAVTRDAFPDADKFYLEDDTLERALEHALELGVAKPN
ncbi:MAG: DUF1040 family protein [Hyphomonadaceae bacterium]